MKISLRSHATGRERKGRVTLEVDKVEEQEDEEEEEEEGNKNAEEPC
jgi:hypothetical protein